MRKRSLLILGLLIAALAAVSAPMVASADRSRAGDLDVVAVTADGRLIEFESDDPDDVD